MRELRDRRLSPILNYSAVGVAGAAGRLFAQPFSAVKIFTEVGVTGSKMGMTRTMYWMAKLHGKEAMFTRGAVVGAARILPHYFIQLSVFDRLSANFVRIPKDRLFNFESIFTTFLAGSCSGVAATLVTHPLDVVKVRLVVQPSGAGQVYKNGMDALVKIYKSEGLYRGLYRGLGISLLGTAAFSGNLFMLLGVFDNFGWRRRGAEPWLMGKYEGFFLPLVALYAAYTISHPFDVIRRKFMAQSYVLPKEGNVDIKFRNVGQCVTQMPKYGNIYSFYAGYLSNMFKVLPQFLAFAIALKISQEVMSKVTYTEKKQLPNIK